MVVFGFVEMYGACITMGNMDGEECLNFWGKDVDTGLIYKFELFYGIGGQGV